DAATTRGSVKNAGPAKSDTYPIVGDSISPANAARERSLVIRTSPAMSNTVVTPPCSVRDSAWTASAHVPPETCTCASMRPGSANRPRPSMTRSVSGASAPTASIRPSRSSTFVSARGGAPVPSITVTCRINSDGAGGRDCAIITVAPATSTPSSRRNGRRMTKSYLRRTFLKTAAALTAGSVLARRSVWAAANDVTTIDPAFLITPKQALDWHVFKSEGGPTYAGSAGWKRFTDFLVAKLPELGAVDLDSVDIPYDHFIVDDWPDRRAHMHGSGVAVETLVTDGTPVPVVASYGMTSGFTPKEGVTAPMRFYDPAHPPAASDIAGTILVFATTPYPAPPYSNAFLDNYTPTDYEWRSPGVWPPLFVPPPTAVTSSYHCRWVWSQLGGFAAIGIRNRAAGIVVVYDLSPGAAFGLAQRSVYTADGKAGLGATYVNCPTLTLDRVNGAKVIADAKAGKTATLTLTARFQRDTGRAFIAHLPGRRYGAPDDEQILIATHTDAMSLVEENGGLGLLGILSYFNHVPRSARARTLTFYFDCRHFMPGGEASWPQFDYYAIHPERLKPVIATLGMEHMGGKQTIEAGPGGNDYLYSSELTENGG